MESRLIAINNEYGFFLMHEIGRDSDRNPAFCKLWELLTTEQYNLHAIIIEFLFKLMRFDN